MKTLNDLFTQTSGKALKKSNQNGSLHKYITTSNLFWGRFDFSEVREMYFMESELEKCTAKKGDLLVCNGGDVGRSAVWEYDYDICLQNHITRLRPKSDDVFSKFYYYAMYYIKNNDLINGNGVGIASLSAKELMSIEVPQPSLPEQQKIAAHLDSIQSAIDNKKQQLQQLDELVKSKFVEMFGENNCKQVPFSEYAEIIDGDRGKNYPKSDEFFDDGYCLFLSAKNVTKNGFIFETNQFISEEKDKILRKGKLKRGDIVITTRGTIGNIAYFDETIPYENIRINSGMVIIRGKDLEFNQKFFLEAFRQKIDEIIATQVTGAAQPQLPIHIMSKITLPYPNIDLQNTFAEYVQRIDSAKSIVKTQLNDLKELLESKMDEYFGE